MQYTGIKDSMGCYPEAYILHLPDTGKHRLPQLLNAIKNNPVTMIDDITIVTTATLDILNEYPLIDQLKNSNIDFINSAVGFDEVWQRKVKVPLVNAVMEKVTTPYTLVLDANDVVILKDIDNEFIEKFKKFDCDIVFNGSWVLYPNTPNTHIESDRKSPFYHHYINAGVCFGYTDKIAQLYQTAFENSNTVKYRPIDSEQYYIRTSIIDNKDSINVKIDDGSHLFLVSNGN
jgi:hypothetical protein